MTVKKRKINREFEFMIENNFIEIEFMQSHVNSMIKCLEDLRDKLKEIRNNKALEELRVVIRDEFN